MNSQTLAARNVLVFSLLFLGASAMGGGSLLVMSPTGRLMGLPLSILAHSPFTNFLIPGIILFSILGLAPCLISIALIKKPQHGFAEKFNLFKGMYLGLVI